MPSAPPKATARLGAKLRQLRRQEGLSQVQLAERLSISPSYLNLIEGNKRPLTAPLLLRLAQTFHLDLRAFAPEDDVRRAEDLMEAFGDPLFEAMDLPSQDVRDLAQNHPALAQAVFHLYQSYQATKSGLDTLADRFNDGQGFNTDRTHLPSEAVGDFLQDHRNHFPELESAAEALWKDAKLEQDLLYPGLLKAFEELKVRVEVRQAESMPGQLRRYDPERKVLVLSELLPLRSRVFQLAHQWALLRHGDLLDRLTIDPHLATPGARVLGRVALANNLAAAVGMPYSPFLKAAKAVRYDIELLTRRFQVG